MRDHRYGHHGFTLGCNKPLPKLTPAGRAQPDISITVLETGRLPRAELPWAAASPAAGWWRAPAAAGSLLRLRYAGEGGWAEFVVDEHGQSVWAGWSENVPTAAAAELLLGPVFSCVLAQRGLTCLHASVVQITGSTIALIGGSGAGKSTLAMALVARGAELVSDDVAVLQDRDGRFFVSSGPPRLRIRPDSGHVVHGPPGDLEPIWVDQQRPSAKSFLECARASNGQASQSHGLDIVCLLTPPSKGCEPELRPVSPAEALARLMANRHMVRVIERDAHRRDLMLLARLAETVPVVELVRPEGLGTIARTAAAVEDRSQALG